MLRALVKLLVFLRLYTLIVLLLFACSRQIAVSSNLEQKLFIPLILDTAKGKVVLRAQRGTREFVPGVLSSTMGYNGAFLGPTVLLHRGRSAEIEVVNQLGEGTTLHSHGALIPGHADGGPTKIIPADSSWLLQFEVQQPAAMLWFHPHKMGNTAAQVWRGLAGLYWIQDEESQSLPLPNDYGIDDIPVVIQERMLDKSGKMVEYERVGSGHMTVMMGAGGNVLLVNGQLNPKLSAAKGWLRLRLLNGSHASSYRISFSNKDKQDLKFYHIASEQGLLTAPQERQFLDIATASRAEVMLKLPAISDTIQLELALWDRNLRAPGRASYPVMSIQVDTSRQAKGQLPDTLHVPTQQEQIAIKMQAEFESGILGERFASLKERDFRFQMMTGGSMMNTQYAVNNNGFDINNIAFDVPKGRYEVWRFTTDMLGHPSHIHGVRFRILQSDWFPNGSSAWYDTFTLKTHGESLVLLQFPETADEYNPYMLHCHMLEHEEAGMMSSFTVSEG